MESAGVDRLPVTLEEAGALQEELADRVVLEPLARAPRSIGAVDAAYAEGTTYAAAVLCRYDTLAPLTERVVVRETSFPYLPGYFWLREAPPLLEAIAALQPRPDVLLVDGQGIAHPRRFGIACHLGVLTGIPSIGCAKSHLIGTYREPGREKGNWTPLEQDGSLVGAVLRTRTDVRPLFISPGHRVTLEDALAVVLHCCTDCRVPEPMRQADRAARQAMKSVLSLHLS
ncbi:MAG TPA: deoxyribonuclease V [Geomonas sp.]